MIGHTYQAHQRLDGLSVLINHLSAEVLLESVSEHSNASPKHRKTTGARNKGPGNNTFEVACVSSSFGVFFFFFFFPYIYVLDQPFRVVALGEPLERQLDETMHRASRSSHICGTLNIFFDKKISNGRC